MLKEWKGFRDQGVFDFTMVRENDEVVAEAKKDKKEVHMARVHGICVEKNYGRKQRPWSSPRQSSEEPTLGSSILSGSRKFSCIL